VPRAIEITITPITLKPGTRIIAESQPSGIDNAAWVELEYPDVKFIKVDGRDLPFANNTFDFVHSSAVLEHVGSRNQQARFLREAWRVARKGVFVTTPNRRYPVEFHTVLPLTHWLPVSLYRKMLLALGYGFFADQNNLNLLSGGSLSRAARAAGIERFRIGSVSRCSGYPPICCWWPTSPPARNRSTCFVFRCPSGVNTGPDINGADLRDGDWDGRLHATASYSSLTVSDRRIEGNAEGMLCRRPLPQECGGTVLENMEKE
jgi:hypothetical protein